MKTYENQHVGGLGPHLTDIWGEGVMAQRTGPVNITEE